jgi:hypothetical protein
VTEGRDKVEAAVDPVVNNVAAIEATLVTQKTLKLIIDVLNYGTKTATDKFWLILYFLEI